MKKSKSNKKAATIADTMRFLTGHASARWLARRYDPRKNHLWLVPMLQDLQTAHDRLLNQESNRSLVLLVKGMRAKSIMLDQFKELIQMDVDAFQTIGTLIGDEMLAKATKDEAVARSCQFIKRRPRSKNPVQVHPSPGEIPR